MGYKTEPANSCIAAVLRRPDGAAFSFHDDAHRGRRENGVFGTSHKGDREEPDLVGKSRSSSPLDCLAATSRRRPECVFLSLLMSDLTSRMRYPSSLRQEVSPGMTLILAWVPILIMIFTIDTTASHSIERFAVKNSLVLICL